MKAITIRALTEADWPAVHAIYEQGIATSNATLETEAPAWAAWDAGHLAHGRLIAVVDDVIVGWAALTPVSGRCVYAGVAEVSVYVAAAARGHGAGRALLAALTVGAEALGLWTLQAGILRENAASLALHTGAGFRVVGVRERIGRLNGVWRDVVLMERRSTVVGLE